MSTLEKLFVQIFERKNWIIDQVKQQRDLYDQHLASKLLIRGIQPPSWLLNAGCENQSLHHTGLKREELIKSLLAPPSRPVIPSSSACCTIFNKPTPTVNDEDVSGSLCMENFASNKYFDAGGMQTAVPEIQPAQKTNPDILPGKDPTVASPQDQTDTRISHTDLETGQSLARIQRSRSRQKALELRNGKNSELNKHQTAGKNTKLCSGRITRSRRACQQELLEAVNSFDITQKSCGAMEEKAGDCLSKENGTSVNPGGVPMTRTSPLQAGCVKAYLELESLSNAAQNCGDKIARTKPDSPCLVCDADFQKGQDSDLIVKGSISKPKYLGICNLVETNLEMHPSRGDISDENFGNRKLQSTHGQLTSAEILLIPDNSSRFSDGKVTQPRSSFVNGVSSLVKSSNRNEGHEIRKTSTIQLNVLYNDMNENVDQDKSIAAVAESEPVLNGSIAALPNNSVSGIFGADPGIGIDYLVRRPSSDSSTFVEPKQLVFDDVEECNETISHAFEKQMQAGPSEIKSFTSFGPFASVKKADTILNPHVEQLLAQEEQFVEEHGVEDVNKEEKVWMHSSEAQTQERLEYIKAESLKGASESSWPQRKRRKIDGRPTNVFMDSPRLSCTEQPQKIQEYNMRRELKIVEDRSDNSLYSWNCRTSDEVEIARSNAVGCTNLEMCWGENLCRTQKFESSSELHAEEDELNLEGEPQGANEESQGFLKEKESIEDPNSMILDIRGLFAAENYQDILESKSILEGTKSKAYTEETARDGSSHVQVHDLFSYSSVDYPCHEDLSLVCADQTWPEIDNFSKHLPKEKKPLCIAGDGISFNESDIPSSAEQPDIFEQLLKSAGTLTPLPPFSVKYKSHKVPDMFQSLPNGFLEYKDLKNTLLFNDNDRKQLKASYTCMSKEINCSSLVRSYSDCMPSSNMRFGWNIIRPYTPPVGKLCQRITSKSTVGGSEKQDSVNPELTCFRIEEDPSTSEEIDDINEVSDSLQEGVSSRKGNGSTTREPLADVTNKYLNPPTSVSAAKKSLDRGSLDSLNTESNIPGTQHNVKQSHGNGYDVYKKCINRDRDNLSLGVNGVQKVNGSRHSRNIKPQLSEKASERKGGQSFLEKGSKRNNIVSNLSSFVPFVQQKQAPAVLTGKRDIKVKSLEAAEIAKRLEEKRENERKMKKEAAKLKRARLDQENLRQLELKQKKKEEERKKKEADMAARKRQREEEERKEKERKKKCTEEARRQKGKHEQKGCTQKKEKDLQLRAADERELKRKELTDDASMHKKIEIGEGADFRKKVEIESRTAEILTDSVKTPNNTCQDNKYSEVPDNMVAYNLCRANEDGNSFTAENQQQSYDISPYQSSDDEEEEDEMPNKKFIPSWASKNNLALCLPSQQKIDPDTIFPPASFCSIDEVLLPRKPRLK